MKRTFILLLISFIYFSCITPAGTLVNITPRPYDSEGNMIPNNQPNQIDSNSIEVYKYYLEGGYFVYMTRFKDQPNIQTANWLQKQGKTYVMKANTIFWLDSIRDHIIYEDSSIVIIKKR